MVVIIGCDESLKGDTFGGLVVAAVKCNDRQRGFLASLRVRDCKKITDGRVKELAVEIKKVAKYSIQSVLPQEYNKHKLTDLMNKLFKKAISDLRPADEIIVDKFPGCKVGDVCEAKADSKYTEVAAASILARDAALKQIEKLSDKFGHKIPLGSTHVKSALEILKKSRKSPKKFVKLHFKNVQNVFSK